MHTLRCKVATGRDMDVPVSGPSEYQATDLRGRSSDDTAKQAKREGRSIHRSAVYATVRGDGDNEGE